MTRCELSDRHLPGVLTLEVPKDEVAPLLLDSPHSGTLYPPDFAPQIPRQDLLRTADLFVDELAASAPARGAVLLAAHFPRAYIDVNRALDDLDPELLDGPWSAPLAPSEKTRLGKGLIWRLTAKRQAIYGQPLGVAEVQARIDGWYRPYHRALDEALDALWARFGQVWHLNCHSMKSLTTTQDVEGPGRSRADIVLSDRDGTSCDPAFLELAKVTLEAEGLRVAVNQPFNGGELVRRHGRPQEGRHALQIEINRSLYMDETALQKSTDYPTLHAMVDRLVGQLVQFCRESA